MAGLTSRAGFLRTRFARRTLLTFLGAALLPSAIAAGLWFERLRSTLEADAETSLTTAARDASVALLSRLDLVSGRALPATVGDRFGAAQLRVSLAGPGGEPSFALVPRDSLGTDYSLPLDVAELWTTLDQRLESDESGYCVYTEATPQALHCSRGLPASVLRAAAELATAPGDDRLVRDVDGWRLAARELFLRAHYDAPSWHLVLARSDAPVAARLRAESRYLAVVGLLALIAAFVLSHVQLRRQTAPIEVLQQATRDVREGRLDTRVALSSNDEFTEFGETFNAMTRTLEQQFALLGDVDTLNQRALRAGSEGTLVDAALERLGRRTAARLVSVALLDAEDGEGMRFHTRISGSRPHTVSGAGVLTAPCRQLLLSSESHIAPRDLLRHTSLVDPQLAAWQSPEIADVLVVPLRQDDDLFGAVLVALGPGAAQDDVAVTSERRLAERLALGLANARLVARLDALSLGTLRAFGSTIDANSRWTAGHSERVTRVAVQLGEQLGVTDAERLTLTRGCLLHDIGKVGIPPQILDKSDRLTDEEFAIVKRHPEIGAQILGSIGAFRDLLPIVRSHHERFDGRGYPDRLVGTDIPWLARIAAVADVFDALASARPYREGLPLDTVRRIIAEGSGSHFDPRVVQAFETLAVEQRLLLPDASLAAAPTSDAPEAFAVPDLFPAIA